MKLKRNNKPTFFKAVLIVTLLCSFLTFRFGSRNTQNVARQTASVAKPSSVEVAPATPAVPPVVPELPFRSVPDPVVKPEVPKKSATSPKKRFSTQKQSLRLQKWKEKEDALTKLIDNELSSFDTVSDAVDIHGPVDDLVAGGFNERLELGEDILFASNGERTSVLVLPTTKEEKQETFAVIGTIKKDDFEEIKAALATIKEQDAQINKKEEEKNILVIPKEMSKPLVAKSIEPAPKKAMLREETENTQASPSNVEESTPNPKEQDEEDEEDEPTLAAPTPKVPDLSPMEASMAPELTNNQFISTAKRLLKEQLSNQKTVATQTTKELPPPTKPSDPDITLPYVEKLHGTLYVDEDLNRWLITNKGHIELSLHRLGSRNPEDTIKLFDYHYPEREFAHDTSKMEGKYQLTANIYAQKDKTPYLQISYPKALSPENFGEKAAFYLKMQKERTLERENPVLNVTVFEAASGNYRQAKAIASADIRIVGLEAFGSFRTDNEGNARIENIPLKSDLMLDVSAPGFYPTRKVVPIIGTSSYTTISLIERQKVDAITGFFTKKPQDDRKAIIFGRVFDPESRKPLVDDQIMLSNRKGRALYFSALPDTGLTSTTSTGMFAFMNVEPAFRALFRTKSTHALPMHLLPGYGYFADLGRGGKKSFKAVVTDPVQNQTIFGTASTIGSNKYYSESDDSGKFEIKDVDLPTGNVTIEFRAKDYPVTWYTLPWDTRESSRTQKLYILEKELIYESAMSFARVRPEKHKGIIVGGADAGFFDTKSRCVTAELYTSSGNRAEAEKGPYLLYERSNPKDSPCLTKNKPGFAFYNLDAGEYILTLKSQSGKYLSSQIVRVGADRLSVVVR